jgi:hypothetical protein
MEVSTLTIAPKKLILKRRDYLEGEKETKRNKGSRHPCSNGWWIDDLQHSRGTKFTQIR